MARAKHIVSSVLLDILFVAIQRLMRYSRCTRFFILGTDTLITMDDPGSVRSTITLCGCMLVHSYLLISVFPYSGYMAMNLLDLSSEQAVKYAGWLASSFMLGRALTSVAWGRLADSYGRRMVLVWSLVLSAVWSLAFGFSPTFSAALIFRCLLGMSNGIMGAIKTLVSELATSEQQESQTMSLVMGMWGWGFLLCPGIAGFIANPVEQYPEQFTDSNPLTPLLTSYPFLIPNVLATIFCVVGAGAALLCIKETLPPERIRHLSLTKYQRVATMKDSTEDLPPDVPESAPTHNHTSIWHILSRPGTRISLALYWAFSFVSLTVDEAAPLFLLSRVAGFGLSERSIGSLLSAAGLLFATSQYVVSTWVYKWYGLYGSVRFGAAVSPVVLLMIPWSRLGTYSWANFAYLAVCLAVYSVLSLVFFANVSVAVNRSVPASERATTNGLASFGGSIAKGMGPVFAGYLVAYSVAWGGEYGGVLIFGTTALLGLCAAVPSFLMHDVDVEEDDTMISSELELVVGEDGLNGSADCL